MHQRPQLTERRSQSGCEATEHAPVSLRFLPRTMIVSPRKRPSVSIVAGEMLATLESSPEDSSTTSRFGERFWLCRASVSSPLIVRSVASELQRDASAHGPLDAPKDGRRRVVGIVGLGDGRVVCASESAPAR